jgi:hypothetical protein
VKGRSVAELLEYLAGRHSKLSEQTLKEFTRADIPATCALGEDPQTPQFGRNESAISSVGPHYQLRYWAKHIQEASRSGGICLFPATFLVFKQNNS